MIDMSKEINKSEIEKYIGKPIWFELGEKKSKPRVLSRCENGMPIAFDESKHGGYYVYMDKEFWDKIKVYTY